MRTIKFRAWDKVNNRFIWLFSESVLKNIFSQSHSDEPQDVRQGRLFNRSDSEYELSQFTGLHDKNGKEIYEGDICKTHDWIKQPNGRQILSDKYKIYKNVVISYNEKPPFVGYVIHDWYEVIGNIYENPELL